MNHRNVTEEQVREAVKAMGCEPVNPIGTCFDSTGITFIQDCSGPRKSNERLCHGIGIANMPGQEGREMIHAWIEFDHREQRFAFDTTWGKAHPAEKYREDLRCNYVVEYTYEETLALWKKHDMPGPWDPKIVAVADARGFHAPEFCDCSDCKTSDDPCQGDCDRETECHGCREERIGREEEVFDTSVALGRLVP